MPEITRDSIPLNDDAALRALVEDLAIEAIKRDERPPPPLRSALDADKEQMQLPISIPLRTRPNPAQPKSRPFWSNYFYQFLPREVWRDGTETWLRADESVLRRVVITGLKNEHEARALRLECKFHRGAEESLEEIVTRVVSDPEREARARHSTFVGCLRDVRRYFEWRDGEAVEGKGKFTGLPISKMSLPADDVEVLRQVFSRLRERSFKPNEYIDIKEHECPTCGGQKRQRSAVKDLKTAREKVKQHGGDYADEGFTAWVEQCLQTKTDHWSRASTPLYEHYREWVRKGGHGGNKGEKAEAKATALTAVKWGQLMRRRLSRRDAAGQAQHPLPSDDQARRVGRQGLAWGAAGSGPPLHTGTGPPSALYAATYLGQWIKPNALSSPYPHAEYTTTDTIATFHLGKYSS